MARNSHVEPSFESFLTRPGHGKAWLNCPENYTIFSQGHTASAVFYLQEGKVKLTVLSSRGKEAVVSIIESGAFFGEQCLTGQIARTMTATVLEHATVLRIAQGKMIRVLRKESSFRGLFLKYLLSRSLRVEEDLLDQLFNSVEKRLARALLLLANFGQKGKPQTIPSHVNQEMLAEMIGTTRSHVNFFMNRFKKLGFVEYNGTLHVHNSLLNVVLKD